MEFQGRRFARPGDNPARRFGGGQIAADFATVIDIMLQVIQTHADTLFRLIFRIVGNREEARDLTQDVFVKVLCNTVQLREPQKMKSYLFTTAYHMALNALRTARRRKRIMQQMQTAAAVESVETAVLLNEAMKGLSEKQRQALTLRFYGDMTMAEVADAMNISEGSVKVHLARGLTHLKERLQPKTTKEI